MYISIPCTNLFFIFSIPCINIIDRYLYWSRDEGIDRKRLNGMEGTDEVLSMPSFSKIVGLMINSAGNI